jgi:hypothetical protein
MNERIDYSTHILIGIKKSGDMTVLAHWPRVPRQADVDGKIQSAEQAYASFVLCTPTSIITGPSASPAKRPLWP